MNHVRPTMRDICLLDEAKEEHGVPGTERRSVNLQWESREVAKEAEKPSLEFEHLILISS